MTYLKTLQSKEDPEEGIREATCASLGRMNQRRPPAHRLSMRNTLLISKSIKH